MIETFVENLGKVISDATFGELLVLSILFIIGVAMFVSLVDYLLPCLFNAIKSLLKKIFKKSKEN